MWKGFGYSHSFGLERTLNVRQTKLRIPTIKNCRWSKQLEITQDQSIVSREQALIDTVIETAVC